MYEVMARRYRPAVFDEVVGQEHIAATLRNAISRDRVAHAYMFTGGHGCGKTTMARILAKALVCEKGPTADPCGVCPICVDVAAGRDADVLEIDGASNNGIEQIRQLREQAGYVPTRARFKIYIIDEVHMLSDGAFNALLKTLEEPPRHVKFILATTDPHKVPDTILSRCQRFDFRLVPQAKLAEFFRRLTEREHASIADDALDAVASFAEGSVRDGLVLLDQLLSFADGEVTRRDVESVRGVASAENVAGVFSRIDRADVAGALAIVDEVSSRGTNVGDFLDQLIAFGRDLMIFAATGSPEGTAAYGPAREELLRLGAATGLEKALLYLDVLTQARTRVRSRALSNPLVALEMAVARLAGLGALAPVSEILDKLDGLSALPAPALAPEPKPSPANVAEPPPSPPAPVPETPQPPATPDPEPLPEPPPPAAEAAELPAETAAEPSPATEPAPETPPAETIVPDAPPSAEPLEAPKAPEPLKARETADAFDPVIVDYAEDPGPDYDDDFMPDVIDMRRSPPPPLTMQRVEPQWERVLNLLHEKHPADVRHMSRVRLEDVVDGAVVLSGTPTALEAWEDKRRLGRLSEAAEAVLGRPVEFRFVARQIKRQDDRENAEAKFKLARHPAVDKIKTLFDGVIVDCRPNESDADAPEAEEEGEGD